MSTTHFKIDRRRGAILFVVVACLALFLSVGIAFVFYANQVAISARFAREASQGGRAANVNVVTRGSTDEDPPDAGTLFNLALGQLIYDTPDTDTTSATRYYNFSAMNGHSLARAMYSRPGGTTPYNGYGRVHNASGTDRYTQINSYIYTGAPAVIPEQETGTYIAKNAPYTYPDENNAYLGAFSATKNTVLVPSFVRSWNAASTLTSLRPRGLAAAPPNTNNSNPLNCDVENLEGKTGQRFDSIWMDLDAPVHKWRGRLYKPLFAFLVLDLDGRINVNVAGNTKITPAGGGGIGTHASNQGWGPWEMNLDLVLNNQGNLVVNRRYQPNQPAAPNPPVQGFPTATYSLDGSASFTTVPGGVGAPALSPVDFDAVDTNSTNTPPNYTLPQFQTTPTWSTTRYGGGDINERNNHPLLSNPYLLDRMSGTRTTNRVYGPEEVYYLNRKAASDSALYAKSKLAQSATLLQQAVAAAGPNYRFLMSPLSNDLQLAGGRPWMTGASTYQQANSTSLPTSTQQTATGSTFRDGGTGRKSDLAAKIGSMDLNRKLVDYRTDPSQPYEALVNGQSNVNVAGNYLQAIQDRQNFAMDIFIRLLVATGLVTDSNVTAATLAAALPTTPQQKKDACRRLAQIAVNMVDYIDNDEYITAFKWNTNVADMTTAQNLKDGWVFGTELPRLAINEVYANWDNDRQTLMNPPMFMDPVDMQMKPYAGDNPRYKMSVYVELHNPLTPGGDPQVTTNPPHSHNGGAVLAYKSGADTIYPYQLIIADQTKVTKISQGAASDNVLGGFDDEYNNGTMNQAQPPAPGTGVRMVKQLGDFNDTNSMKYVSPDQNSIVVPASNAKVGKTPTDATDLPPNSTPGVSNPSFYLIGPKEQDEEAKLPGMDNVPLSYGVVTPDQLRWDVTSQQEVRPQTILLRRLLCPHVPHSPLNNPYITVDYIEMTQQNPNPDPNQGGLDGTVGQIFDHRQYVKKEEGMPKGTNDKQYKYERHTSYGRNQPYDATTVNYKTQGTPAPAGMAMMAGMDMTSVKHTFYKHNNDGGDNPPKASFDWLAHFDRSLVSPIEIMMVSAWKPHELTKQFILNGKPQQHLVLAPPTAPQQNGWLDDGTLLYRAFGLLETRNRTNGMGFGGRIPGRVNINTMWDDKVLNAVSDATGGVNSFAADVQTVWTKITEQTKFGSANWVPGQANQTPGQPFHAPFGAGYVSTGRDFPGGLGVAKTPLMIGLHSGQQQQPGQQGLPHPYQKLEMLNKVFNNFTTRSNTFAVYCTIGYFEVTNAGPYNVVNASGAVINPPALGQELGIEDGTNIRHRFFAVVDRTNLTIDSTIPAPPSVGAVNSARNGVQGERPVFLSYEPVPTSTQEPILAQPDPQPGNTPINVRVPALAASGTNGVTGVYDGQSWTIKTGDIILLDLGANQEAVTVTGVSAANKTITFQMTKSHYRGCIMQLNYKKSTLGNPGPQPNFNYKDVRYSGVVPFVTQIN